MGELRRMTQFKEKSEGNETVRAGLFTYPVLMAADILLYDADAVPVGDDQRQHLELARELADPLQQPLRRDLRRARGGHPGAAARVMDLQHPERKMSKSVESPLGTIGLLDSGRGDHPQGAQGGHRHRRRGPLRPGGQARPGQPARPPGRAPPGARRRRWPRATRATATSRTTWPRR
jgi:hypothetical protein